MKHVPPSRSAYQPGRSTTEQVFTLKLLAEKAVTSADYNAFILLMDMSKAFDTVIRKTLLEDLRKILNPDELHIIKIFIEKVELSVRIGKTTGEPFTTNVGIPQGDSLSPVLFILYLAKAMEYEPALQDHSYNEPGHLAEPEAEALLDHTYCLSKKQIYEIQKQSLIIPLQHTDDIGYVFISKDNRAMQYQQSMLPQLLMKRNLTCNESKTEHTVLREMVTTHIKTVITSAHSSIQQKILNGGKY